MCFALNKGASLIKECAQALQKLEPNLIPVALFEFLTKLYRFLNCKLSLSFSKVIYGMERVCVCVCFSKSSFTGYHLTFTFSGKTLTFIYWQLIFLYRLLNKKTYSKSFCQIFAGLWKRHPSLWINFWAYLCTSLHATHAAIVAINHACWDVAASIYLAFRLHLCYMDVWQPWSSPLPPTRITWRLHVFMTLLKICTRTTGWCSRTFPSSFLCSHLTPSVSSQPPRH